MGGYYSFKGRNLYNVSKFWRLLCYWLSLHFHAVFKVWFLVTDIIFTAIYLVLLMLSADFCEYFASSYTILYKNYVGAVARLYNLEVGELSLFKWKMCRMGNDHLSFFTMYWWIALEQSSWQQKMLWLHCKLSVFVIFRYSEHWSCNLGPCLHWLCREAACLQHSKSSCCPPQYLPHWMEVCGQCSELSAYVIKNRTQKDV